MTTENDPNLPATQKTEEFLKDYVVGQAIQDQELRRSNPRYPLGETVDLMIDSADRPAEIVTATGRDLSQGGVGIYSHRPIPPGTDVVINIDNGRKKLLRRGLTVHSTLSVGLFKIGTKFTDK